MQVKLCEVCSKPFKCRCRGSGGKNIKYCSDDCRAIVANVKQVLYKKYLKKYFVKKKNCLVCGQEFIYSRSIGLKYCGIACSKKAKVDKARVASKIMAKADKDKLKLKNRIYNKTRVKNLTDSYIREILKQKGINPTDELVILKREDVKLKRTIYEKQRELNYC